MAEARPGLDDGRVDGVRPDRRASLAFEGRSTADVVGMSVGQQDVADVVRATTERTHTVEDLRGAVREPGVEHRQPVGCLQHVDVHQASDNVKVLYELLDSHVASLRQPFQASRLRAEADNDHMSKHVASAPASHRRMRVPSASISDPRVPGSVRLTWKPIWVCK